MVKRCNQPNGLSGSLYIFFHFIFSFEFLNAQNIAWQIRNAQKCGGVFFPVLYISFHPPSLTVRLMTQIGQIIGTLSELIVI